MNKDLLRARGRLLLDRISAISLDGNISGKHTLASVRRLAARQDRFKRELRRVQRLLLSAS